MTMMKFDFSEEVLVIGNGFDLYHFLPTRYIDFLRAVNVMGKYEEFYYENDKNYPVSEY